MTETEAYYAGRAMRALELLAYSPLSAPQLALAMGSHPRTIRRMLERLEIEDWVRATTVNGRRVFEPTFRMIALAGQMAQNATLPRRARPYVSLLAVHSGAAAHLVVTSYQSVICLAHDAGGSGEPIRVREVVPAHCTAGGKALMAERERWRESLLAAGPFERHTERTVVDPYELREQLVIARRRGFAIEDGEYQPRVRALAAPVIVDNDAVAALCVSGRDLDLAAVERRVVETAEMLSHDLAGV